MKKEGLFLLICILPINFFSIGVYAQEDISTIDENAELQETEGVTPEPTSTEAVITGKAFLDYYFR